MGLNKRRLITQHVLGLDFVDVGGLWGTRGEMVTTAIKGGASRAAMVDVQPMGSDWWRKFEAHCAEMNVQGYEMHEVDICAPDAPERLGGFDFVHCSGIMYHVPDLFRFVGNLAESARKYLLLSSVVMPERIETPAGSISFGADQAYLTPILSEPNREIIRQYLADNDMQAAGITRPAEFFRGTQPRTGPWWWLFSGAFMSNVVSLYGLTVLAEGPTPGGHGYTIFAKVQ